MKILLTHPKDGTAIHRLSLDVKNVNKHHQYRIVAVHPKRPDEAQLNEFVEAYKWCDLWDSQYWKTSEMLLTKYGNPLKKPIILTHHNPYDLLEKEWKHYNKVVVMNKTQKRVLKDAIHIPHAIDVRKFAFNDNYTTNKTIIMVAQRIEGKKGVLPVALACQQLGYKLILVGQISNTEYFTEVMRTGAVTFYENISDSDLIKLYRESAIHVCNSVDNFESGTLPILESMAIGVPVLTRNVGLVPDISNDKNMLVRDGAEDDVNEIRSLLKFLMENLKKRKEMREEAWRTVRTMDTLRRARAYSQLYYKTLDNKPLVSVIMPVFGRPEELQTTIDSLDKQTYTNLELVIISDGDDSYDQIKITSPHTIKYIRVGSYDNYGLGIARDTGVMEAEGEILLFLDQRFIPDPRLVAEFLKELKPKLWLYGNKDSKRNFVENVSCIYRQDFINMGMSNQLINMYGGMSQELRERSRHQGIKHVFVEKAKATAVYSSHNANKRKYEILEMKNRLWKLGLY